MKYGSLMAALLLFTATSSAAAEVKLGNWNIQTLVYAGDPHTVFEDDRVRQPADSADLRNWRDKVGADIFFLQEVSSPAAIDEVFPVAGGWQHCISGQYAADEHLTVGPVCTKAGDVPAKPTGIERRPSYKIPSLCWADMAKPFPETLAMADDYNMLPIEFFVFGEKTRVLVLPDSEKQVPWTPSSEIDRRRLSDHCPSAISLKGV